MGSPLPENPLQRENDADKPTQGPGARRSGAPVEHTRALLRVQAH